MIEQVTILAMELNRSHVGKLVQIITESWSMTGTLSRVDQHDNREWDIDYANGGGLIPRSGEIYTGLWIGPWRGEIIGNQPVTVETVRGTLEAPERNRLRPFAPVTWTVSDDVMEDAAGIRPALDAAIEGTLVEDVIHHPSGEGGATHCGLRPAYGGAIAMASTWSLVTCQECRAFRGRKDLPPEPPVDWVKHRHQWVLDPQTGYDCKCGEERPLDYRGE